MNKSFSGWRAGFAFYAPVMVAGLLISIITLTTPYVWSGVAIFVLGIAMALFFRDFPREIIASEDEVVAPADGRIVAIENLDDTPFYDGPCQRISIFLSLFDAHINRAPFSGKITAIKYKPGLFKDARKPETTHVNESNAIWFETEQGPMTVRQISGAVARRIVCPVEVGMSLVKGEKFGMIRFGSRTELYLPLGMEIRVSVNEKVKAGTSVVASYRKDETNSKSPDEN